MSRRASTAGRSDSNTRHRSRHAPGPMALVWITVARGVMAIVLGLAGFELADRSGRRWRPGVPLGVLEIGLGTTLILTADRHDSLSTWLASAWAPRRSRA